jgi:hypothetical protein
MQSIISCCYSSRTPVPPAFSRLFPFPSPFPLNNSIHGQWPNANAISMLPKKYDADTSALCSAAGELGVGRQIGWMAAEQQKKIKKEVRETQPQQQQQMAQLMPLAAS